MAQQLLPVSSRPESRASTGSLDFHLRVSATSERRPCASRWSAIPACGPLGLHRLEDGGNFGAGLADPSRRVVLVQGDGAHQLTSNQIGAIGHYGLNPIILLRNNGVFGIEEIVMGNSDPARIKRCDRLPLWQYHKLPEAMGCRDWFCTSVDTNAELDAALKKARTLPGASYIQIQLGSEKLLSALPAAAASLWRRRRTRLDAAVVDKQVLRRLSRSGRLKR